MSKIALEPNVSGTGTFTIASPNSNTSRTLTLPDADGALLTTTGDGSALTGVASTPASTVIYVAQNTAPTGYLKANGAAISRTTYADLFAAIGTTFGSGDGSTTFNVPDLRGEFIRAWDDGRGVDSGRSFGSTQADGFKSHTHNTPNLYRGSEGSPPSIFHIAPAQNSLDPVMYWTTTATGGNETRPRNIALLACIKY
jgi:microcystin-dependent protein